MTSKHVIWNYALAVSCRVNTSSGNKRLRCRWCHYHSMIWKESEKAGEAANSPIQGLWLTMPVFCHKATAPTSKHPSILSLPNSTECSLYRDGGGCLYAVIQWKTNTRILQSNNQGNWAVEDKVRTKQKTMIPALPSENALARRNCQGSFPHCLFPFLL